MVTKTKPKRVRKPRPRKLNRLSDTPIVLRRNSDLRKLLFAHPDQVIHATKIIGHDHGPSFYTRGTRHLYLVGVTCCEPEADTRPHRNCGRGLHVGTFDWCVLRYPVECRNFSGELLATVEFRRRDIAALPRDGGYGDEFRLNGKFRVFKLRVLSVRVMDDADRERYFRAYKRPSSRGTTVVHKTLVEAEAAWAAAMAKEAGEF